MYIYIYIIVFEAFGDTLCSGSGLCFSFGVKAVVPLQLWTCAFLRHDLPLHLVTCGADASHLTVQIKAASPHRIAKHPCSSLDFVTVAITKIFQIYLADLARRLTHEICMIIWLPSWSWRLSNGVGKCCWAPAERNSDTCLKCSVCFQGTVFYDGLSSLRSLPNRWRIHVPGTIGCAKLHSAFKQIHPPTSPFGPFTFQESRALNNPPPTKVIVTLVPSNCME